MQSELMHNAKRFVIFWALFFVLIWGLFLVAALTGDETRMPKAHLLLLLSMILAGVATLVLDLQQQRRDQHMAIFIDKLRDLQTDNTRAGHILMRPDDSLAPLAEAINDVQRLNRNRIKLLQQQGSTLAALMANMPLGALRITPERTIIQTNPQAQALLGLTQNVVGRQYDDVIKNHRLLSLFEQSLKRQTHVRELVKLDARIVDVSLVYYETRERHHELLVLLYDMTEVTQMQDMQSAFIANASHELRTPLTAISGFTETLLSGAQEDPEARQEFLTIIQTETNRLLELTEDILTIAKVPERQETATSIKLSDMVNDIFKSQAENADKQQLTLQNEVAPSFTVTQDATVLRQILTNLIVNAVKYNRHDGLVKVSAMVTASEFVVAVKDTGLGIPSEQQNRIFERFYRIDKSRNQTIPGTGLGLAIVNDLVNQAKGTIDLDSQVGVGTTITVTLPLQ